jgi:hypothetical protein
MSARFIVLRLIPKWEHPSKEEENVFPACTSQIAAQIIYM